jgi:hypothetical protein
MTPRCPHCLQLIRSERFGVPMSALKADILDRIKAAGEIGVASDEIIADLYCDRRPVKNAVIKAHVFQINDLLASGDWRICSDRRRWFLRNTAR